MSFGFLSSNLSYRLQLGALTEAGRREYRISFFCSHKLAWVDVLKEDSPLEQVEFMQNGNLIAPVLVVVLVAKCKEQLSFAKATISNKRVFIVGANENKVYLHFMQSFKYDKFSSLHSSVPTVE